MKLTQPGVYMLLNLQTDARYVGSAARSLSLRKAEHLYRLRRGDHRNAHLQASWNKHGEAAFVFVVLENCPPEVCLEREEVWYQRFKEQGCALYNKREHVASQLGFKQSRETVDRVTAQIRGKKRSAEYSQRRSEEMRGTRPDWMIERRVKEWPPLLSPDGKIYRIRNLHAFCVERGLDTSTMRKIALGKPRPLSYKGWRRAPLDTPDTDT